MASPRSRFISTAHSMKELLPHVRDVPGVRSVAVNAVAEDVGPDEDRIQAVLVDGSLSDTTLATSSEGFTVERRGGVDTFKPWDLVPATRSFLTWVRRETDPAFDARERARIAPPAPAVREVLAASEAAKASVPASEAPKPTGPKARFRETTVAVGLVRERVQSLDGVRGFVVNPDPKLVDDGEDRLHALLDDGSVSEACIYCAPGGYGVYTPDGTEDGIDARLAADAFLASVRLEAMRPASNAMN